MENENNTNKTDLRHMFISMLFALVVGQIALSYYEIFKDIKWTLDWFESISRGALHLLFALLVITTSWVSWSKSFARENYPVLEDIYSKGYALLLIDVVIVILYFALVESYDKNNEVSALPEVYVSISIFSLYFIWGWIFYTEPWKKRILQLLPALLCTSFSILILKLFAEDGTVVLSDLLLILNLVLFRVLRELFKENDSVDIS